MRSIIHSWVTLTARTAESTRGSRSIASRLLELFGLRLSPDPAVLSFVDLSRAPTGRLDSLLYSKNFSRSLPKTILLVIVQRQVEIDYRRVSTRSHGCLLRKVKDNAVNATAVDQKVPDERKGIQLNSYPAVHELAGLASSDFWPGVKR